MQIAHKPTTQLRDVLPPEPLRHAAGRVVHYLPNSCSGVAQINNMACLKMYHCPPACIVR
jgi:hypothetical protein